MKLPPTRIKTLFSYYSPAFATATIIAHSILFFCMMQAISFGILMSLFEKYALAWHPPEQKYLAQQLRHSSLVKILQSLKWAANSLFSMPLNTLPITNSGWPTNWWQGYISPSGDTAKYSKPAPQATILR